jgi:twitching motility protein PilT
MKMGMMTMEQSLSNLVRAGVISFEMAVSKSSKPEELQRILAGAGAMGAVGQKVATGTGTKAMR